MANFTEILNPFINVRNKIKNSNGIWVDQKKKEEEQFIIYGRSSFEPGQYIDLFSEFDSKVIIDSITLYSDANVSLSLLNEDVDIWTHSVRPSYDMFTILRGHTSRGFARLSRLYVYDHPYLETVQHHFSTGIDEERYFIMSKRNIEMPNGCKLAVLLDDESEGSGNAAWNINYRVIKG